MSTTITMTETILIAMFTHCCYCFIFLSSYILVVVVVFQEMWWRSPQESTPRSKWDTSLLWLPSSRWDEGNPLASWVPPLHHIIQLVSCRVTTPVADYSWQPVEICSGLFLSLSLFISNIMHGYMSLFVGACVSACALNFGCVCCMHR